MTLIEAPASLYAGAMVGQALFPSVPMCPLLAAGALIAGVYIFFGGLSAVVINDALQAAMIMIGGILVLVLAWQAVPCWVSNPVAVSAVVGVTLLAAAVVVWWW
ncbi:sodium:solute symporter family transporter [Thiorhodovibrio winogradskyi]|uniref:sodium:solute symporter family transporter n=1 Tax=Thiorhodovibrio winogradskyi TaxID=77007 RepID=UPI002E27D7C0|nr:hypothetical protein [Thiorhodovibrio winogradskyi]